MAIVNPFCAVRPKEDLASEVAALPYDVYSREEAREAVKNHPLSFLNIDRPETQFPEDMDMYDRKVYEEAKKILEEEITKGIYIQDTVPSFYLYELIRKEHRQTGIVGCAALDDYLNGIIKRHENTRPEKEKDRIRHVDILGAQTGPIFLAYEADQELKKIISDKKKEAPVNDFISEDHIQHRVWVIQEKDIIKKIQKAFEKTGSIYIADGHHRAASAVKAGLKRRKEHPDYTGKEEFNYFLCTLFSEDELEILDYNRVVKDLNGYTETDFLKLVEERFYVRPNGKIQVRPKRKGCFGMYLGRQWYELTIREEYRSDDAVEGLDVAMLQNHLLNPILHIQDPARDERIQFIGGIRGLEELERKVETDCKVAFSMYPTSMKELFAVAEAGKLMPPKSTWFEPKLRSGLFIHRI